MDGVPWEYWRWEIIGETGWTLDYVDALPVGDFVEWLQVRDGRAKARRFLARKDKK